MSFTNLSVKCEEAGIFSITLEKPPENRLTTAFCHEIIRAFRYVEAELGEDTEGAVILRGEGEKFFTTGLDLHERDKNKFASSDGFYPLLATVLDFPFPTIALINGHVFGGASLLTLAHDYRVMNSTRGYWQMPPVNLGLHHPGMGTLIRAKLQPKIQRKVLLEAHKYKAQEALEDGIVDAVELPERMLEVALKFARQWRAKAKMGVYGILRNELVGEALRNYQSISYVHHRETSREAKVKL